MDARPLLAQVPPRTHGSQWDGEICKCRSGMHCVFQCMVLTYSILFYSISLDFWKPKKETKKWFFDAKLKRQVDYLEETVWLCDKWCVSLDPESESVSAAISGDSSSPASKAHVRQSGRESHAEAELLRHPRSGRGPQCGSGRGRRRKGRSPAASEDSRGKSPGFAHAHGERNQVGDSPHLLPWSAGHHERTLGWLTGGHGSAVSHQQAHFSDRVVTFYVIIEKNIRGKGWPAERLLPSQRAWSGSFSSTGSQTPSCRGWPSPIWRPTWTDSSRCGRDGDMRSPWADCPS